MTKLIEILKYIIPSLIVFATAYLLLKAFLKQEERKMQQQRMAKNSKQITPIRLQAYERLLLFLERIHPESLIIRENSTVLNNLQFQQKLVAAVRTEFEHNLAQQLYISDESWLKIKNAKNSIIHLINTEAAQVAKEDSSLVLSKAIIEAHMQMQKPAIELAISSLKNEVKEIWC